MTSIFSLGMVIKTLERMVLFHRDQWNKLKKIAAMQQVLVPFPTKKYLAKKGG